MENIKQIEEKNDLNPKKTRVRAAYDLGHSFD